MFPIRVTIDLPSVNLAKFVIRNPHNWGDHRVPPNSTVNLEKTLGRVSPQVPDPLGRM